MLKYVCVRDVFSVCIVMRGAVVFRHADVRDLEICFFCAAIFCTCDCLHVYWLPKTYFIKLWFSLANIFCFPYIYLKHVGEVTNYKRIYLFVTSANFVLLF